MEVRTYLSFPRVVLDSLEAILLPVALDNQQAALRSSKKWRVLKLCIYGKGDSMP